MTSQISLLTVIDRDSFVPFFYQLGSVKLHSDLEESSTPHGHPALLSDLFSGLNEPGPETRRDDGQGRRLYWLGWPKNFDFVLLQHYGAPPPNIPTGLTLVANSDLVNLYRISH